MESAHGTFAGQHKARQNRFITKTLSEVLIQTRGRANLATTLRLYPGQNSRGSLGMSADNIVRMCQPVDEIHFLLDRFERRKRRAEFQISTASFGPPFGRMDTVSEKQKGKSLWRSLRRLRSEQFH